MSRLVVVNHLSLDGVMQAPGRPDEDRRDGFAHGGWANAGNDPEMAKALGVGMGPAGPLLFGRRTYEDFAAVWPARQGNPFTEVLNESPKYVASRTLRGPLPWKNSTLLAGEAAETVGRLKEGVDRDIVVLGSGDLLQTLMRHRLVDRWVLLIHPVVLGKGRRLFAADADRAALRLASSVATSTGVIIATYEAA